MEKDQAKILLTQETSSELTYQPRDFGKLVSRYFIISECSTQILNSTITSIYKSVTKWMKKRHNAYNEWILNLGQGAFTTINLPTNGGLGRRSQKFYRNLSSKMSGKRCQPYFVASSYIRRKTGFPLRNRYVYVEAEPLKISVWLVWC